MPRKTFYLTSLGCAKNAVDSDSITQLLERDGYRAVRVPEKASVLIVNTCGFIQPARQESLSVLREMVKVKQPGQTLIAAGCLTQRYGSEIAREVPGIDGILGTRRWMDIPEVIRELRKTPHPKTPYQLPDNLAGKIDTLEVLQASIAGTSAYLKIADGCRRPCAFCAIPLIKGSAVSRPMEAILHDARRLGDLGMREINLIAQDTTDYGYDLGMRDGLPTLLEHMITVIPDVPWIRIMYAFPGYVTERLMDVMARHPQIVPYLDMPLQHAHPETLRRMRRPANMAWVRQTITQMRAALPGLAIRTTFIVGYPGETEDEFQTLLDFISETRFDRVGTFKFSFESGTPSEALGDPIPEEVKDERYQRLMSLQQNISLQINQSYVGHILNVLIEGYDKGLSIGRSYRDAPEIDGLVLLEGKAEIGNIIPVRITSAMAYDLIGVPA